MLALARPELVEKPLLRNYLRARGEYLMVAKLTGGAWELPPRTRRIPHGSTPACVYVRTTSAHAENTLSGSRVSGSPRNYLRARGEYFLDASALFIRSELPPRTRRILNVEFAGGNEVGTTSAHAENTCHRR